QRTLNEGGGGAGSALPDEDDGAPPAVRSASPDVEAEVDLLELPVERDGQAEHRRLEEQEADEAHVRAPLPEVELRAGGDESREVAGVDRVVQHRHVPPLRAQERRRLGL